MLPEVRLSYNLTADDLEASAARNATSSLSPRFSRPYLSGAFLRGSVVFLLHYVAFGPGEVALSSLLAVGVAASWFAWAPVHARRLVLRRMRLKFAEPSSSFLMGPRTLELGPDGFAVLGPESELRYKWSALQRVVATPERLFFYLTGFTAHVVPLPPQEAERVIQVVRRYAPPTLQATASKAEPNAFDR
jgi:hypothetical protein